VEIVDKKWGRELIIANEPEYCGKILVVKARAGSSIHRHLNKKETFYCLQGKVILILYPEDSDEESDDETMLLTPEDEPITILPGRWHHFHGVEDSQILEVSTHHDDSDVERKTESYGPGGPRR